MKIEKMKVAVLGAGNMGTAIAKILAENGHNVVIWNWHQDLLPLQQIEKYHENRKYLPKIKLPKNIIPVSKLDEALKEAEMVFFVVPSTVMEYTISFAARSIKNNAILVDVSKGVDPNSLAIIPDIIARYVRPSLKKNIASISGPAIAKQMAEGKFTAMNVASKNKKIIIKIKKVLENSYLKLFSTTDVIGVEISGSFKNVYSIGMGICDALKYDLNTKAALVVRAVEEISLLITAMGGKKETAYELAGLGDLIGTSLCDISRNRSFGYYLGKGIKAAAAAKKVKQIVEGVEASRCLMKLSEKYRVKLPFAELIYKCIAGNKKPGKLFSDYLKKIT